MTTPDFLCVKLLCHPDMMHSLTQFHTEPSSIPVVPYTQRSTGRELHTYNMNTRSNHHTCITMRRQHLLYRFSIVVYCCILHLHRSIAFTSTTLSSSSLGSSFSGVYNQNYFNFYAKKSATKLNVWWFGGTPHSVDEREECELVAVRIERTSPNSRRIWGEIEVPSEEANLEDVWAILTDYDRLTVHVPNLVESRRLSQYSQGGGSQGDGQYRCRLFQKGAQKIVGFEFGASVTMDMAELVRMSGLERGISFKCVDSAFFSEFDGEWNVKEGISDDGITPVIKLRYLVDVRPKGPVPVTALEWRIREDVPTNLRAVKKAAIEVGAAGVTAFRNASLPTISTGTPQVRLKQSVGSSRFERVKDLVTNKVNETRSRTGKARLAPVRVTNNWGDDETMAKYLKK